MKRIAITFTALSVAAVSAFAIGQANADGGTWHCYITVGGTPCAEDGTPLAAQYEADARRYAERMGWAYAPIPGTAPPTTSAESTIPVEKECFILVGGTLCFEVGSPEWERARGDAEEYQEVVDTMPNDYTISTTVPETTLPAEPTPEVVDIGEPVVVPVEETTVVEAASEAPAPTTGRRPIVTLPETS